jgi:hypothetical protein
MDANGREMFYSTAADHQGKRFSFRKKVRMTKRYFSDQLVTKNELHIDSRQFAACRAVGLAEADAFAVSLSAFICG